MYIKINLFNNETVPNEVQLVWFQGKCALLIWTFIIFRGCLTVLRVTANECQSVGIVTCQMVNLSSVMHFGIKSKHIYYQFAPRSLSMFWSYSKKCYSWPKRKQFTSPMKHTIGSGSKTSWGMNFHSLSYLNKIATFQSVNNWELFGLLKNSSKVFRNF